MKYNSYQETGYSWFSFIPEHWHLMKNGAIFKKHQNKVGDNFSNYELLSLTTNGIKRKDINDVKGKVPVSYEGYQEVHIGDIVFCLFDLDCSAVFSGLSKYEGMITSAYEALTPSDSIANARYLDYWFQYVFFNRNYKIYSKSVRYTINYDIFKAIKTPIPPREEQDQIVRYLDWQISKINRLISAARREIALIKEIEANQITSAVWGRIKNNSTKQSGILGIGEVPEHWAIRANKRIFKERNEKSESGTETLLSVSRHFGVKPSNELSEDEQYATIKPAESLVGYKIVKKNDLAMNIMRAQNGSYGISDYEGIVSPAYCVYELLPGYSPKYMHYLLKTPQMISIFFAASSGITDHRRRLYADDFLRIKIAVPPLEEQEQIVEQIEKIEATFQGKTAAIEKQIELLKELRTRLISDVVTGQIDVRGVEIPEYEFVEDVSEDSEDSESEEEIEEQEDE